MNVLIERIKKCELVHQVRDGNRYILKKYIKLVDLNRTKKKT